MSPGPGWRAARAGSAVCLAALLQATQGRPAWGQDRPLPAATLQPAADVGPGAVAGSAPAPAQRIAPRMTPLTAPLLLNGKLLGSISGDVATDGAGQVDTAQLLAALKPVLANAALKTLTERIGGQAKIALDRLQTEDFSLRFDPLALEFQAELKPGGVAGQAISLRGGEPPDLSAVQPPALVSGGANLSIGQVYDDSGRGLRPLTASIDGLLHVGRFHGPTLTFGGDYDGGLPGRAWQRREIRLTQDVYARALRITAGEFTPSIEGYQGARRLLGVSIERSYGAVRPFENIRPLGRQDFLLDRDSTVDVYVNNVRLQTLRLQPGRYSISDFPFAAGPNQVRLEVEDSGGRREIAAFDAFNDAELLKKGIVDFGASVGEPQAPRPYAYEPRLAFTGYLSKGFTDNFTGGLNLQSAYGRWQVGSVLVHGSRLGVFLAALAASGGGASGGGALAGVVYRRNLSLRERDDFRLTAAAVFKSAHFHDVFSPPVFNEQAFALQALAQWSAPGSWGLSAGYAMGLGRGSGPDTRRFDVGISKGFRSLTISATAAYETVRPGRESTRFTIGLSRRFGGRWFGDAHYDSDRDRSELRLTRSSTGRLNDVSGELDIAKDRAGSGVSGRLLYLGNRFEAELMENRLVAQRPGGATVSESRWRLSSFIGFADGAWGVGRPVGDAFVIAPLHPTLAGSTGSLSQGDIVLARTGLLGAAVASLPRAYGSQSLVIGVEPLPQGYDLGSGAIDLFPSFGAGYRAPIGSAASHTAIGILMDSRGPVSLRGGEVRSASRLPGAARPFFTNRSGRFVADQLAPGQYQLVIEGRVVGEFSIPQTREGLVDVGQIHAVDP